MPSLLAMLDFGPTLDVAARSRATASGAHQLENQDNFVLIDAGGRAIVMHAQVERAVQLPHWPAGHVRLAVLDGMGGHGHGREAAEAVAAGLLCMPACHSQQELGERLDQLHLELQTHFNAPDDPAHTRRPGTTLTLLELRPGLDPLLYHVGDSRLYEITAAQAQALTIDHVPATAFALHGLLGAQEWRQQVHEEHRPQIAQAFILGNAFANPQQLEDGLYELDAARLPGFLRPLADRRALTVRSDALYLLATDGFWACRQPHEWTACWPELLGRAPDAGAALDALFAAFCGAPPPGLHPDNLTAITLRFGAIRPPSDVDETALPNMLIPPFSLP